LLAGTNEAPHLVGILLIQIKKKILKILKAGFAKKKKIPTITKIKEQYKGIVLPFNNFKAINWPFSASPQEIWPHAISIFQHEPGLLLFPYMASLPKVFSMAHKVFKFQAFTSSSKIDTKYHVTPSLVR